MIFDILIMIEFNGGKSLASMPTNAKTKTAKDFKYMSKLQLKNYLKKIYESAPQYLKARLENVDVRSLFSEKKDLSKKEPSKNELVGYIETLTEGVDGLPLNVTNFLENAKHSELKKLAMETKLIKLSSTMKKEELIDIMQEVYKSKPYLFLGKPEFEVLAVGEEKTSRNLRMIFNAPLEFGIENSKKEEIETEKPKKSIEEIKKKNLVKYQVIVLKFVDEYSDYEITKKVDTTLANVKKCVKIFEDYADISYKVPKSGRPKLINEPMEELIKFNYKYEPTIDIKDLIPKIKEEFDTKVSSSTILRCLNKMGKFVVPKSRGALNAKCKQKRHYYCVKMSTRSFQNIIFTDESMIELKRNKRKIFRLSGTQAIKRYVPGKVKIMVWGAISMKGKICFRIHPPKTKINSEY